MRGCQECDSDLVQTPSTCGAIVVRTADSAHIGVVSQPDSIRDMLPRDLDDGFVRTTVEHELRVVDPSGLTISVHHRFLLKCERASRFVLSRYEWTGTGDESTPLIGPRDEDSAIPSPRLHGPAIQLEDGGRLLVIDLGRVLEPGEITEVTVDHTFVDTGETFQPFITHKVTPGNERVAITAILPTEMAKIVHFSTEVLEGSHKQAVLADGLDVEVQGVACRSYTFDVLEPSPGCRYAVRWA